MTPPSPLPWKVEEAMNGSNVMIVKETGFITRCDKAGSTEENEANAKLICRAVNSFGLVEELVKALSYELTYMENDKHKAKVEALLTRAQETLKGDK